MTDRNTQDLTTSGSANNWWRSGNEKNGIIPSGSEAGFWSGGPVEISRRQALRLLAASAAASTLAACDSPPLSEAPVATTTNPNDIKFFATTLQLAGYGVPIIATMKDNRPVKLDGNADHPAGVAGSDVLTQAATLALYDPQRADQVAKEGQSATWADVFAALADRGKTFDDDQGETLAVLLAPTTSPALTSLVATAKARWPKARWHVWDPLAPPVRTRDTSVRPLYHLDKASVIVALDSDLIGIGPDATRNIAGFATGRRARSGTSSMTTLMVAEPALTLTGATADNRLVLSSLETGVLTFRIAGLLGLTNASSALDNSDAETFANQAASALKSAGSSGLLSVGADQSSDVHQMAAAINDELGSLGNCVEFVPTGMAIASSEQTSLASFVNDLTGGKTKTALVLSANPVYDAPPSLDVAAALGKAEESFCLSQYANETSAACTWQLPEAHDLESWGDLRTPDGTVSLRQPLIRPLFNGRSQMQVLAMMLGDENPDGLTLLRQHIGSGLALAQVSATSSPASTNANTAQPPLSSLQLLFGAETYSDEDQLAPDADNIDDPPPTNEPADHSQTQTSTADNTELETQWREALSKGFVSGTEFSAQTVDLSVPSSAPSPDAAALTLYLRPDPSVYDGSYAENAWLQETPKPLTKLTWTNALEMSASDAASNGIDDGELVELTVGGNTITVPALISPGMAEGAMRLDLGYGRTRGGAIATGLGANGYALRGTDDGFALLSPSIKGTGKTVKLPTTQTHHSMEGRDIVRQMTLAELAAASTSEATDETPRLYDLVPGGSLENEPAWGMVIDQSACVGCNACVAACQAENNVAIVGAEEINRGRNMHWLRIDRYFGGGDENPDVFFQPVNCMHCEVAPCEAVCPVGASIHDETGLNVQVYNRCVGTRFCEANCPYQVRRFNFLHYSEIELDQTGDPAIAQAVRNPDVTVRSRGIMEKCTYCVQRLKAWDIDRQVSGEDEPTPQTACQQACPSQAISFGDLRDEESKVAELRREPHHYALLADKGTRPRTTYLARVTAPVAEGSS